MAGKRVTIYISEDNLPKWQQIEHKSEWVNDMLGGQESDFERRIQRILKELLPAAIQELQGY